MERFGLLIGAMALDWVLGDPPLAHPVRLIGGLIAFLERGLRCFARTPWALRISGGATVVIVVALAYLVPYILIHWVRQNNHSLAWVLEVLIISLSMACRGLAAAARKVYGHLVSRDLAAARKAVREIVGRDTENLSPEEVIRAAVEAVAENTVDAVISPLFYALIGGAPLAMAYRAINTLDSMLGYRSERYRDFGWLAAKTDDLANYVPARLTGTLLCLSALLLRLDYRRAWQTMRREARRHPSPNAGFPEAAVAGALGVRLGGVNYYGGVREVRPYLGEPKENLRPSHILGAVRLMLLASLLYLLISLAVVGLAEMG